MDLNSIIELMEEMLPGTIVDAQVDRNPDRMDINFTITKVNGKEVEEA